MKIKYTLLPALICGVIMTMTPAIHAQDATTSGSSAPAAGGKHQGGGGGWDPAAQLDRLTKALTLTDDQVTKIKPILQDESDKIKAVFQDTTVQQADKRAKIKPIRDAANAAIKALLTPDQATKFDALLAKRAQGGGKGGNGGGGNGGGTN